MFWPHFFVGISTIYVIMDKNYIIYISIIYKLYIYKYTLLKAPFLAKNVHPLKVGAFPMSLGVGRKSVLI